ncbi:MarR family transcriptional regulator [Streptomyces sp. AV19]|uniref:MarR family winged helix-turn-helix transcriptional regulator n=1 Tax=Streptomyces sp. AV19 TaxID=2793068 RepID=UPI0024138849|nr:MarR family transcriptional regulator [Streptomyces sp. AV19]MDG4536636.1 MarR family transcriptional regulator [Streptomyces sp. AV19]
MPKRSRPLPRDTDDVAAVTRAVLTASRVLVAVLARSLAAVEDRVTLPQFRLLVVLSTNGPVKLVTLAELLGVNPSTAMRMVDRLHTAGLISREINPDNRRETMMRLTAEGLRIVEEVTGRRREEIAAIVARMAPATRGAPAASPEPLVKRAPEQLDSTAGTPRRSRRQRERRQPR